MPTESPLRSEHAVALAHRLRQLRSQRELSQEDVAHLAGISRNQYQLLEKGLSNRSERTPSNPRLSTLISLCVALGTTVPDLVIDVFGPPVEFSVEFDGEPHG